MDVLSEVDSRLHGNDRNVVVPRTLDEITKLLDLLLAEK